MIPINFEINSWKVKVPVALMIYKPNLVQMITTDRIYLGPSNSIQIFILEYNWSLLMLLTINLFFPEMTSIFPNQLFWYQLMNCATCCINLVVGRHDCFTNRHLVHIILQKLTTWYWAMLFRNVCMPLYRKHFPIAPKQIYLQGSYLVWRHISSICICWYQGQSHLQRSRSNIKVTFLKK